MFPILVAQGKAHYDRVLAKPALMPKSIDEWCEALLGAASTAHERLTGTPGEFDTSQRVLAARTPDILLKAVTEQIVAEAERVLGTPIEASLLGMECGPQHAHWASAPYGFSEGARGRAGWSVL
jgi:hypothetical protein